jgi:hypothetical protein
MTPLRTVHIAACLGSSITITSSRITNLQTESTATSLFVLLDLLDGLHSVISGPSIDLLPFLQYDHDPTVNPRTTVLSNIFEPGQTVETASTLQDEIDHSVEQR